MTWIFLKPSYSLMQKVSVILVVHPLDCLLKKYIPFVQCQVVEDLDRKWNRNAVQRCFDSTSSYFFM